MCVVEEKEIQTRRLPAVHPAPTPTRRVGPVAGRLGSVGRARVGYVSSRGCAGVSEFSGLRETTKECPRRRFRGKVCVAPGMSPGAGINSHPAAAQGAAQGHRGGIRSGREKGKVCSKSKLWDPEAPGARPLPPRTQPRDPCPPRSSAGTRAPDIESCPQRPGLIDFSPRAQLKA